MSVKIYILEEKEKSYETIDEFFVDSEEELEWYYKNYKYPKYKILTEGFFEDELEDELEEEDTIELKIEKIYTIPQIRSGIVYAEDIALVKNDKGKWYIIKNVNYYRNNNKTSSWSIDQEDVELIGDSKEAWLYYQSCFYDMDEMEYTEADFGL